VPDIGKKLESGDLSLKAIRTVESFIYHEGKARGERFKTTEKQEIYAQIEKLSVTQIETKLANIARSEKFKSPALEKDRALQGGGRVVSFTVTEAEYVLLQKAKDLLSHKMPGASVGDVYKAAVAEFIERKNPKVRAERIINTKSPKQSRTVGSTLGSTQKASFETTTSATTQKNMPAGMETNIDAIFGVGEGKSMSANTSKNTNGNLGFNVGPAAVTATKFNLCGHPAAKLTRYIPAKENHKLWQDYDGKGCTFTSGSNGKRCGSTFKLQRTIKFHFFGAAATRQATLEYFVPITICKKAAKSPEPRDFKT
jgi:hypothetical protein